tara:strand:- start:3864 stop:4751 length:888 start_codon:yes stop_codon:yes gene_type:complete
VLEPWSLSTIIACLIAIAIAARVAAGLLRRGVLRLVPRMTAALRSWLLRVAGVARLIELARRHLPRATAWIEARFAIDRFSGLPLTLIALLAAYLASIGTDLAEEVIEQSGLVAIDRQINQALAVVRDPDVVAVFGKITHLADITTLVAVAGVASAFLWADRRAVFLPGLSLSIAGSQLITYVGKYVIDRPRPEFLTFAEAATPSFPSGHATGAMAVYGFIAYAILRDIHQPRLRFELAFWAGMLIAAIAASRMILSVHYASDVAAGLIVGGFWLLAGFAVTEYLRETFHYRNSI